jgi:hypothetical protein
MRREKRRKASERGWWIERMMVRLFRDASLERVWRREKAVCASRPVVGSSRQRTEGRVTSCVRTYIVSFFNDLLRYDSATHNATNR